MKRIIYIVFAAFVLTMVPAAHACAQWEIDYPFEEINGPFYEGLACVMDDNEKWGFVDETGKVVIPYQWESATYFNEGLAAVMDANDKWGFIDKTGKIVE